MLPNLKKKTCATDVAQRTVSTDNAIPVYMSTIKSPLHESISTSTAKSESNSNSRKKPKNGPPNVHRTKVNATVKPSAKRVSTVEDADDVYTYTPNTDDDDSDDMSLPAFTKEKGFDNLSKVHTIHVIRRMPEHGCEPRLVAIKKLERLVAGLDTDEANIIFQPETTPWKPITPDKHEAADHIRKTSAKNRFSFLHMKSCKNRDSELKKAMKIVSSIQVPNGYTAEEEDECKTVPLRIIHTESNDDSVYFFHYFATTRAWAQLRTLLKVISVPELRSTIKAVGQLKLLKAKQQNALHLICKVDPPIDIMERIIHVCPVLPSQKDIYGQFPLHTVLAYGVTSWLVVEMLVNRNVHATEARDNTGMTPLMTACRDMIPDDESIIFSLLAVCPYVINVEDENEMNAIEFALLSECSWKMLTLLRRVSRDEWRLLKESQSQVFDVSGNHVTKTRIKLL